MRSFWFGLVVFLCALSPRAFAAGLDAGAGTIAGGVFGAPGPEQQVLGDPVVFFVRLASALEAHQWPVAAGLGLLVLAVVLLAIGKRLPFFRSKVAHTAVTLAVLTLGALGTPLAGGARFSLVLVATALGFALVASGVAAALLHYVSSPAATGDTSSRAQSGQVRLPILFAFAAVPAFALLGLAALQLPVAAGCAAGNAAAVTKKIAIDSGACALGRVPSALVSLVPEAQSAIAGTPADWSAEIARLEAQGVDVAVCIVEAIVHELSAPQPSTMRASLGARASIALDRAQVYLAAHRAQLPDAGAR